MQYCATNHKEVHMHIITRQVGDVIVRNDDVEILVLSIDGKEVKLGIEIRDRLGPDDTSVQLCVEGGRRQN